MVTIFKLHDIISGIKDGLSLNLAVLYWLTDQVLVNIIKYYDREKQKQKINHFFRGKMSWTDPFGVKFSDRLIFEL